MLDNLLKERALFGAQLLSVHHSFFGRFKADQAQLVGEYMIRYVWRGGRFIGKTEAENRAGIGGRRRASSLLYGPIKR